MRCFLCDVYLDHPRKRRYRFTFEGVAYEYLDDDDRRFKTAFKVTSSVLCSTFKHLCRKDRILVQHLRSKQQLN